MPFYVNTQKPDSSREIARLLEKCIKRHKRDWTEIVFLCIGSDRVTGDCLGPYVGYRLSQHQLPGIFVYGTSVSYTHLNPWDLLQPQDAMSRHRGAKPLRRCELLGVISLLSPG